MILGPRGGLETTFLISISLERNMAIATALTAILPANGANGGKMVGLVF